MTPEHLQPVEQDPFDLLIENASAQLMIDWDRDCRELEKYEKSKVACGCRKCRNQYDRLINELAEKWMIPTELVPAVGDSMKKRRVKSNS